MSVDAQSKIVVFAGPSLPSIARPVNAAYQWRPPVQAGEIFDLCGSQFRAVVIIDGYFDERPAVRHKEILALIAEGVPVVGAASMGALRAAELCDFGMIGVGRIFQVYASGRIEGDDEVAILHGPEELDWCPLTVPLINIRATLLAAVRARVCDKQTARTIFCGAKEIFYKERTWPLLLEALAMDRGLSYRRLKAFASWLPTGYVDLKRLDALASLELCRGLLPSPQRPAPPETPFSARLRTAPRN